MPPESSLGILAPASGGNPAIEMRRRTSESSNPGGTSACSRSGVATFSATVSDEKSAPSWNIMPNRVRSRASSPADAVQTSVPRSRTVPAVGRSRPMISRNSTDLPVPLPPMIATTCPRATENETPSWIGVGAEARHDVFDLEDRPPRHRCGCCVRRRHRPSSCNTTANAALIRMTATMHCTTVEVVLAPMARVSRRTSMPMRQPITAMTSAKTGALTSPMTT